MSKYTKQIPLSLSLENDQDILVYLERMDKGVRSNYLRKLIRSDMRGETIESKIRRIVAEEIAKNGGNSDTVSNALKGILD